ncbi:MAG: hypothetical protein Q9191_002589 [Dirinaria sp. TL-2023a]
MASTPLSNFCYVLQREIRPNDQRWVYTVPNLPSPSITNNLGFIKSIAVVSDRKRQEITLRFRRQFANRAVDMDALDCFISISFEKFRLQYPLSNEYRTKSPEESQPTPPKESTEYIVRLLSSGIYINNVQYRFYGHSNSQLKSKTCFLCAASKEEISRKINVLGDFAKIKTVAKLAKRIGLLFSAAEVASQLQPDRCQDIPDITQGNYKFTDGCGLISTHLARLLVQKLDIRFRNNRYLPSVFQIRYRGYKGVLELEPNLKGRILAQFRDSMKKIENTPDLTFSVVEYSKPYSFGYLNDEIILLLEALGIPHSTFHQKQREYLDFLSTAPRDARSAFRLLSYLDEPHLAERVLMEGLESVEATVRGRINNEYSRMINKRDEQRCRILIPKSRLVFGVCDPRASLKSGECFLRITMDGDGVPRTIVGTEVLVTRNPCLHPGDVQKFKAVQRDELVHLVDCIAFPTQGRRPSADLMSGGDLDGDKFFVCWDSDLIPSRISQAASYQGAEEPVTFAKISYDDRLRYFAAYTNASLGRVKNLYMDWARLNGPMSSECQELNYLFSRCVDGNRIKVPHHLEEPPKSAASASPFVLDALHEDAKVLVSSFHLATQLSGLPTEGIEVLLCRDNVAFSEFELFKMTAEWCARNKNPLKDFLDYFDFNQMSDEEKSWVVAQLPPEKYIPSLVQNALLGSKLLSTEELRYFKLDIPLIRWKCVFDSSTDRLGRFMETTGRVAELFHRKLIVIRADTRLTLAIYIPSRVQKSQECVVNDGVRLFAFPHSQESSTTHRLSLNTKIDYRLYLDDGGFQLYQTKRANTWVFLTKPGSNDSTYRDLTGQGDRRRARFATLEQGTNHDWIMSIALGKFSASLTKHVGRINRNAVVGAEVYVISNRDSRSLQILDQWLSLIDTRETLPLFDNTEKQYALPTMKDVDWAQTPALICDIARDAQFFKLPTLQQPEEQVELLEWLLSHGQNVTLRTVFEHLLSSVTVRSHQEPKPFVLEKMVDFLRKRPSLVITFTRLGLWAELCEPIQRLLNERVMDILDSIIASANDVNFLVVQPFKYTLSQVSQLSFTSFSYLTETISLMVHTPDVVLDLLLGCLEPESTRLLVGMPKLVQYFVKNCIGIAIEHADEANESLSVREDLLNLTFDVETELVKSHVRIDSHSSIRFHANDHVQFTASTLPTNSLESRPSSVDALVEAAQPGYVSFRFLHPIPPFLEECSWRVKHCGSFVTSKAMFEALNNFITAPARFCNLQSRLLALDDDHFLDEANDGITVLQRDDLNQSQEDAIMLAMTSPLTCVWGPPGTGKTHTLAVALELLSSNPERRILVTAPTHNAVDNIMRKYLAHARMRGGGVKYALRVSTDVRRVAEDLRQYTCDAMYGKDLNENPAGRKKAQRQINQCRMVFTTCIGAGLGLLRTEMFDTVIIDEASQQTEPQSLVPLAKGCSKAILVGDHVQLRATVIHHARLVGFEVSMFERLYSLPNHRPFLSKVMLDTQYRMQSSISAFSSTEFYESRLKTAVQDEDRPLLPASFPWPCEEQGKLARMFFLQCSATEDLGRKSKSNQGQAELTKRACRMLLPESSDPGSSPTHPSVAVLAPYSRQVELLQELRKSAVVVHSIDGFQGREADVVIFVSTRCNVHADIGFLKDMRRLNVVLTRARCACIIIGDRATLTGGDSEDEATQVWRRLIDSLTPLSLDEKLTRSSTIDANH